jgi:TRAP-type C4-dicarboxylate transport system permease small subunit
VFIKQRQVRRPDRFRSRWSRSSTRRREYLATLYTTGVVQFFLSVFLMIGSYHSWQMMRTRFPDLPWYGKLALPAVMMALAVIVARALYNNIQNAREASRPAPPSKPG